MRVKSFRPSVLIVSGRSNGRRSNMTPPLKWHGWQRRAKIGLISLLKSTFAAFFKSVCVACVAENTAVTTFVLVLSPPEKHASRASKTTSRQVLIVKCYCESTMKGKKNWSLLYQLKFRILAFGLRTDALPPHSRNEFVFLVSPVV